LQAQFAKVVCAATALDGNPDNEALQTQAKNEQRVLSTQLLNIRNRALREHQAMELAIVKENLTLDELKSRRAELQQPGPIQKLLIEAAHKANSLGSESTEALEYQNDMPTESFYSNDLQDIRDLDDSTSARFVVQGYGQDAVAQDRLLCRMRALVTHIRTSVSPQLAKS